jgi:hypothetical protein
VQPGSAALTTAGGGGKGGRRCAAARLGSASQVGWGARVVGEAARLKRRGVVGGADLGGVGLGAD